MTFLQLTINGVALGAAYALVALGFVFIVNATGAVNFAHGDLVMAGGYVAVGLGAMAPVPIIVLLPLVAAIMFAIGVAFSVVAYFPLVNRPRSSRRCCAVSYSRILSSCCLGRRRAPHYRL
jgi:branched-chain amino acid transport system permease protein